MEKHNFQVENGALAGRSKASRPAPLPARLGLALYSRLTQGNLWLLGALMVAGIAHAWNLFSYPYLENDEGLYAAQAYSVFNEGKLTPYTYWYDHPPMGWMQIGVFLRLTGLMTFGNAVNGGRVFITLVYLITCFFMFKLVLHLVSNWLENATMRYATAFGAVAFMSLSPLAIFFQRQVLLDNIMVAWVMAAFYILLVRYPRDYNLLELYGSAMALGVGILTKEVAVVFIPVMLFLVWRVSDKHHRQFAVTGWLTIALSLVSAWFLYAFLKGEFFPSGSFLSGGLQHVSILETLKFQAGRGTGLAFWQPGSDFRSNWETNWSTIDKFSPILGVIGLAVCLAVGLGFKSKRALLVPVLPALIYGAFLLRGGVVLYYYILPLLPWFAMGVAMAASLLLAPLSRLKNLSRRRTAGIATSLVVLGLVAALAVWQVESPYGLRMFTGNQTYGQKLARDYVLENVPNNAVIVADDFFYLDLRQPANAALAKDNVQIYFKVDTDTDVKEGVLKNDWRNIDYMLVTLQQLQKDLQARPLPILNEAFQHSHLVKSFPSREGWELQLLEIEPLEIKKVEYPRGLDLKPGDTFEATVDLSTVKNKTMQDFNFFMELRQNGQKVAQDIKIVDRMSTGDSKTFSFKWVIPQDAQPGDYEINLGAFDKTWAQSYLWKVIKQPVKVS